MIGTNLTLRRCELRVVSLGVVGNISRTHIVRMENVLCHEVTHDRLTRVGILDDVGFQGTVANGSKVGNVDAVLGHVRLKVERLDFSPGMMGLACLGWV